MGESREILIAGGGLGGLAAAIALRQKGFQVAVFEKSSELREVGAGLSVWPNATRVLARLGLLEQTLRHSQILKCLRLQTWKGKVLAEVRCVGECETPTICIHRADLLAILSEKIPTECIHLGEKLETFEQNETEVVARFASGKTAQGRALIGADGIHSTVRRLVLGQSRPIYRGYHAWRGVARFLPKTFPLTMAAETWGRGLRFGMAPMGSGQTYWYATANAPEGALGNPSGWKNELREAFGAWASPIPELIEASEPDSILKHDMVDRRAVRRWGRGRVTLLGDAAHLTTPNLGQGACMALEDAAVLADCLGENREDLPAPLRRYESQRYARAAFIIRESRRIGQLGQLENSWAVALRTTFLRMIPGFLNERRHRLYFSYDF